MARKADRNRMRRTSPRFEALESRELLTRTLPIPLAPPGVRTVVSGQAFYAVRLSGPGQMHVRPLGNGQFGVDLFGTTEASELSVTRTRVGPRFQGGSLSLGRIDVKSGQLGAIQAPVAVLQGTLRNLDSSVQAIALGGIGPRARVDLGGNVGALGVGSIQLGPNGLLHVGGGVGTLTAGQIELNGGTLRVDGGVTSGTLGGLALRDRSQFLVVGSVGTLGVLGHAAILGGSTMGVGGDLGGLNVGGTLLVANAGRLDVARSVTGPVSVGLDLALGDQGRVVVHGGLNSGLSVGRDATVASGAALVVGQDASGTVTVGDDLLLDAGHIRIGRDLQAAATIGDDFEVRGGGRFTVVRDVIQPFHVRGDARFAVNSGLFVDRNLQALRVDGNLDTTAGGVLRVGANLNELTVGGVIVGRGALGTDIPDIRIGLNLNNLTVRGMLPNQGGIARADIDVIKSIVGIDIRHGVFDSLITAGVLIDGGPTPSGGHIGPDGTAAVQDSQIRAGVQIRNFILNGDVVSTPGGVQPTRIVAGQDRNGTFRAAGNIDNFQITGSLIDAVVVASVAPSGGDGGYKPVLTWPASPPSAGYDAVNGYLTGGTLAATVRYRHYAAGAFDEFGQLVGFVYDTTLDPTIDDVILPGAINTSLVPVYPTPDDDPTTVVPLPTRSTVLGGVFRTPGAVDYAGLFAFDTRGVFVGALPQ